MSGEPLVVGDWIVDVINLQKIFGLNGLKGHIMEIRRSVTLVDGRRTDGRNLKIELEFCEAEFFQRKVMLKFTTNFGGEGTAGSEH